MADSVHLGPRERQIAALYATGSTVAQIGVRLKLRPNTVESAVRDVRRRYLQAGRPAPTKQELRSRLVEDGHLNE